MANLSGIPLRLISLLKVLVNESVPTSKQISKWTFLLNAGLKLPGSFPGVGTLKNVHKYQTSFLKETRRRK